MNVQRARVTLSVAAASRSEADATAKDSCPVCVAANG
jgi:hypothetical protein